MRFAKEAGEYEVSAVISNRPEAAGLVFAKAQGIDAVAIDHKGYASRSQFDAALSSTIDGYEPDLIVLAGFMRILTPGFTEKYSGRLVNIHPSLLPAFPGLNTHQRALDAGVRIHGVTVHLVTPELDHGPILDQGAVVVKPTDTADTLAERLLHVEHQIYPRAVANYLGKRLAYDGGKVFGATDVPLIFDDQLYT